MMRKDARCAYKKDNGAYGSPSSCGPLPFLHRWGDDCICNTRYTRSGEIPLIGRETSGEIKQWRISIYLWWTSGTSLKGIHLNVLTGTSGRVFKAFLITYATFPCSFLFLAEDGSTRDCLSSEPRIKSIDVQYLHIRPIPGASITMYKIKEEAFSLTLKSSHSSMNDWIDIIISLSIGPDNKSNCMVKDRRKGTITAIEDSAKAVFSL